jgi:hypothetical protein
MCKLGSHTNIFMPFLFFNLATYEQGLPWKKLNTQFFLWQCHEQWMTFCAWPNGLSWSALVDYSGIWLPTSPHS